MGRKGAKTKGKSRLAVDFKRVKSKVGKKVAPSRANTDTSFSAKGISLREQNLGLDKSRDKADAGLTRRGQSLAELLAQSAHYSAKVGRRREGRSTRRCTLGADTSGVASAWGHVQHGVRPGRSRTCALRATACCKAERARAPERKDAAGRLRGAGRSTRARARARAATATLFVSRACARAAAGGGGADTRPSFPLSFLRCAPLRYRAWRSCSPRAPRRCGGTRRGLWRR